MSSYRTANGGTNKSRTKYLVDVVTVTLETGMRKAELLGLAWGPRRSQPRRDPARADEVRAPARGGGPMRQVVYNLLAGLPGPREGHVWPTRKIRTAFESAVDGAGLDGFRFHGCRHHFASWFMMRGGQLQALKELLGHRDIKTTLIYAHLSPAHLRAEVAKTERPVTAAATPAALSTSSAQSTESVEQPVGERSATA